MPTYEYKCTECGYSSEILHNITDDSKKTCPTCVQKGRHFIMTKGFGGGIGIHFKGTGFYETDYKGK